VPAFQIHLAALLVDADCADARLAPFARFASLKFFAIFVTKACSYYRRFPLSNDPGVRRSSASVPLLRWPAFAAFLAANRTWAGVYGFQPGMGLIWIRPA
jgi:hypothetical protein